MNRKTVSTVYRTRLSLQKGWIFLLLLSSLFLAACGDDETPTPIPPTVAPSTPQPSSNGSSNVSQAPTPTDTPIPTPTPDVTEGRIVLWHSWASVDGDALSEILAIAQQRYPNLTVDTLFVAYDDLAQNYAQAVLAGGGPDLVLAPNWWLGGLVEANVVVPLNDLVTSELLNTYWPAALENLSWDNQLYGLPTNFELISLYYNRTLVSQNELPETTEHLLTLSQQNPRQGMGLYMNLYHLYWGIPAFGGSLMDENGTIVMGLNTGSADFLTWLAKMNETPGNFVDTDYGMLLDRFKKGEYAFFVDGPWSVDELRGALGGNLDVAPLPAGTAGPGQPWLSADGFFLNPNSSPEQRQRTFLLAQQMTNAESGAILTRFARRLPANRAADVGEDPILQGFMRQAATAQSMPSLPEMDQVWGYAGDMFIKVLDGRMEPAGVVLETATLINEANGK